MHEGDLGEDRGPQCSIPVEEVSEHFSTVYAAAPPPPSDPPSWLRDDQPAVDILEDPILPQEAARQIRRMPNDSAPGPDRVSYRSWKQIDPDGVLLARIFEICHLNRRVPASWKHSITILLNKKGDQEVISNWRPICLQNTLYKLFAALLARRLTTWAVENDVLCPSQKGFLPYDGCAEHSFLLQALMQDSRRRKRNLTIVWVDLANAFGSVPHVFLFIPCLSAIEMRGYFTYKTQPHYLGIRVKLALLVCNSHLVRWEI